MQGIIVSAYQLKAFTCTASWLDKANVATIARFNPRQILPLAPPLPLKGERMRFRASSISQFTLCDKEVMG